MKGLNFNTILLGFVLVALLISVGLIVFTMYKLSGGTENVMHDTEKTQLVTAGLLVKTFWTDNKAMLAIPTVANVISMVLIGVLIVVR